MDRLFLVLFELSALNDPSIKVEDFENRPFNNTVPLTTGSIADHFFFLK